MIKRIARLAVVAAAASVVVLPASSASAACRLPRECIDELVAHQETCVYHDASPIVILDVCV